MAAVGDPFEHTATGILGDKRDSMLQNELLLKSELARPVRRGYVAFPGNSFRYGSRLFIQDGGASAALRGWSAQQLPSLASNSAGRPRDFEVLNKAALRAGLTSAPENYAFRATHDVQRRVRSPDCGSRHLPSNMVFGASTRSGTPIHELLEFRFQDEWIKQRKIAEARRRSKEEIKKFVPGKASANRASLLRAHQVPVDSAPLWKLPKFSKHAKPSVNTFRTDAARSASFQRQQTDGVGRTGTLGQGVYHSAKF